MALRGGSQDIFNHPKSSRSDRFEFYPSTTPKVRVTTSSGEGATPDWSLADRSAEEQAEEMRRFRDADDDTKRRVASSFASMTLTTRMLMRLNLSEDEKEREASELLRVTEESVGTMTNILGDDDSMILEVPQVGNVTMVRSSDKNKSDNATVLEGVNLVDQANLRNEDGNLVASLFVYDSYATRALKPERLASGVIAVTTYDSKGSSLASTELDSPLKFQLEHSTEAGRNPVCAYWSFEDEDWSDKGCRVVDTTEKNNGTAVTTCECDHLTNFAVILDLASSEDLEAQADLLRVLTLVLCSISAICLVLSLIYFAGKFPTKNDK